MSARYYIFDVLSDNGAKLQTFSIPAKFFLLFLETFLYVVVCQSPAEVFFLRLRKFPLCKRGSSDSVSGDFDAKNIYKYIKDILHYGII